MPSSCVQELDTLHYMKNIFLSACTYAVCLNLLQAEPKAILDLETVPKANQTLIWSPLFQAMWDEMNEFNGGNPEPVSPENKLITALDSFKWDEKTVLPENEYAIYVGNATQAFAEETARKVREKFGIEITTSRLPQSPTGTAAYGILLNKVDFTTPFFDSKKQSIGFSPENKESSKVHFFGTKGKHSERFNRSIKVLKYEKQSFALSIGTKTTNQKLIIYLPDKKISFRDSIENILQYQNAKTKLLNISTDDTIKIPHLSFTSDTNFTDLLKGARYFPELNEFRHIIEAYQITSFHLDKKGAKVYVKTGSADDVFGGPPQPPEPRDFIYDKPFYVFLWQDGAKLPYFASWVGSTDGMKMVEEK